MHVTLPYWSGGIQAGAVWGRLALRWLLDIDVPRDGCPRAV